MTGDTAREVARAEAALELRRPAEAKALLESVIARSPGDARALVLLARAYCSEGDFPRVHELTRRAAEAAPDDVSILVDCADVARQSHDVEAAYFWAERALALAPESLAALNLMSLVEAQRGRGAEALVYASAALHHNPADPDLLVAQGVACAAAGDLGGAAAHYCSALEREPEHLDALNNLAIARLLCGDLRRASALLSHAMALDPQRVSLREDLDLAGALARRVLLSRLGLGTVLAAALAYGRFPASWLVVVLAVVWTAVGAIRLPGPIVRRLGSSLAWQDLLIFLLIVLAVPVASGLGAPYTRPSTFLAWIAIFAVTVMGRLYWNRIRADRRLRALGVQLPEL